MDWKKVVAGVAPTIATALGGPLAGTAVGVLAKEFLGAETATEDQIEAAVVNATPEQLVRLREIDNAFKATVKSLNVDLVRIASEDRQSARNMATSGQPKHMAPQIMFSLIFVVGYFVLVGLFLTGRLTVDNSNRDILLLLLGVLTAGLPMILRFWFGGSLGDEQTADRIYNAIPGESKK